MKKVVGVVSILVVLAWAGCKKENILIFGKIKTATSGFGTSTYTYDNQGRVILAQHANGSKDVYIHGTDTFWHQIFSAGATTPSSNSAFDLNSQGYYSFGGKRTYNSQGYLLQVDWYPDFVVTYSYSGGNLIQETTNDHGTISLVTYTYDSNFYESRDWGLPYFGKGSKNLVSEETRGTNHYVYTYEFDSQGRVSKQTQVVNNAAPDIGTYTYY